MTGQELKELLDRIQWHDNEFDRLCQEYKAYTGFDFKVEGPRDLPEEAHRGVHEMREFVKYLEEILAHDREYWGLYKEVEKLHFYYQEMIAAEEKALKKATTP